MGTMGLWDYGDYGTMGTMGLWDYGDYGTMGLWDYGTMGLWDYGITARICEVNLSAE